MFSLDTDTRIVFDNVNGNISFEENKQCPQCKTTLFEISRSGVVGCATCYKIFENEIKNIILKNQGSINHIGKISSKHVSKIKIKETIEQLERKKEIAASEENYIVAESLKNQIDKLKGELGQWKIIVQ